MVAVHRVRRAFGQLVRASGMPGIVASTRSPSPPSSRRSMPVAYAASGPARWTMARATSSGVPMRPSGTRLLAPAEHLGVAIDRLGQRRADQARRHRVDADAVVRPLLRELAAQHHQRGLGRRVGAEPGKRGQGGHRSHGDDRPRGSARARAVRGARQEPGRTHVDREDGVPGGDVELANGAPRAMPAFDTSTSSPPHASTARSAIERTRWRRQGRPRCRSPRRRAHASPRRAHPVRARASGRGRREVQAGRARGPTPAARSTSRVRCRRSHRSPAPAARHPLRPARHAAPDVPLQPSHCASRNRLRARHWYLSGRQAALRCQPGPRATAVRHAPTFLDRSGAPAAAAGA